MLDFSYYPLLIMMIGYVSRGPKTGMKHEKSLILIVQNIAMKVVSSEVEKSLMVFFQTGIKTTSHKQPFPGESIDYRFLRGTST